VADPDRTIALGVGIFAGIKERKADIKDLILTDICPFSLGTSVLNKDDPSRGDYMSTLIPRNSSLPASRSGVYYTSYANQTALDVEVRQGEDLYAKNNLLLGNLTVNVPPAPKGKECIHVRYTYDINGLLVVDVHVPSTGEKKQLIFVNGVSQEADEALKKQMMELEKLVIAPKDDQNNQMILSRAEGLYAQLNGKPKHDLADLIKMFSQMLDSGSKTKIIKASKALMNYMDHCEQLYLQKQDLNDELDDFHAWFANLGNAEDDAEFEDWGGIGFLS
jgi:molecular chaperone HscC